MDVLFRRYANPFPLVDGMILSGGFSDFVSSFMAAAQEEENEKRDRQRTEREEEHYKKLDELIKQYSGRGLTGKERRERKRQAVKERKAQKSEEKRKKHSLF